MIKDELRYWNAVGDHLNFSNMVKGIIIHLYMYTCIYTSTGQISQVHVIAILNRSHWYK